MTEGVDELRKLQFAGHVVGDGGPEGGKAGEGNGGQATLEFLEKEIGVGRDLNLAATIKALEQFTGDVFGVGRAAAIAAEVEAVAGSETGHESVEGAANGVGARREFGATGNEVGETRIDG